MATPLILAGLTLWLSPAFIFAFAYRVHARRVQRLADSFYEIIDREYEDAPR